MGLLKEELTFVDVACPKCESKTIYHYRIFSRNPPPSGYKCKTCRFHASPDAWSELMNKQSGVIFPDHYTAFRNLGGTHEFYLIFNGIDPNDYRLEALRCHYENNEDKKLKEEALQQQKEFRKKIIHAIIASGILNRE